MFAYDRNPFYYHKNIKTLFQIVNNELKLLNQWFWANKLSLNANNNNNNNKTKHVLFHEITMCDSLPLQLPTLTFITLKLRDKFLGAIINENLTWKNHIEVVENKTSRNIGVLYRVVIYLISKILKIYFSFTAIYISYDNIAWASTFKLNSRES